MDALALPAIALAIIVLISVTTFLTFRAHAREKKQERLDAEAAGQSRGQTPPPRRYKNRMRR